MRTFGGYTSTEQRKMSRLRSCDLEKYSDVVGVSTSSAKEQPMASEKQEETWEKSNNSGSFSKLRR
jgi:hypothetical protein